MKRIAVIPNNSKDIGLVNTKRLVEFLNGKAEIYIDEAYSVLGLNVNYVAESESCGMCKKKNSRIGNKSR